MDVSTITMTKEEAQEKLDEYETYLRKRSDDELEEVKGLYEAVAKGKALLNLADAIQQGGCDGLGMPCLAVARADKKQVCYKRYDVNLRGKRVPTTVNFYSGAWRWTGYKNVQSVNETTDLRFTVEGGDWIHDDVDMNQWYSLIPLVPPKVRMEAGMNKTNARQFYTLWEVEEWSDQPHIAAPPVDPILLKSLGGYMYTVEGVWDLTELERAVMGGRSAS